MSADLIEQYLARLRASLPARDAERIMAEAEDHLRETERAGLAAGLTEPEAHGRAVPTHHVAVSVRRRQL